QGQHSRHRHRDKAFFGARPTTVAQARARLALSKPEEKVDPEQVPGVKAAKQTMELEAERIKKLYDQGTISQSAWDEPRTRAETSAAQSDAAVNGIHSTTALLTSAQAQADLASKDSAWTGSPRPISRSSWSAPPCRAQPPSRSRPR